MARVAQKRPSSDAPSNKPSEKKEMEAAAPSTLGLGTTVEGLVQGATAFTGTIAGGPADETDLGECPKGCQPVQVSAVEEKFRLEPQRLADCGIADFDSSALDVVIQVGMTIWYPLQLLRPVSTKAKKGVKAAGGAAKKAPADEDGIQSVSSQPFSISTIYSKIGCHFLLPSVRTVGFPS